jgi:hypothetical protein
MRFAFKTAPQYTTWADMLALWQVADDVESPTHAGAQAPISTPQGSSTPAHASSTN